jgi:hypothetical protein
VTAESSSSLSVTWEPPEKDKRNGIIVSYTVCISHEENKPCFREYTTREKMVVIDNLMDSTEYYAGVLASTEVGPGPNSERKGKFTNGSKCRLGYTRNAIFINMHEACGFIMFYQIYIFSYRTTRGVYKWNSNYTDFLIADSFTTFHVSRKHLKKHTEIMHLAITTCTGR